MTTADERETRPSRRRARRTPSLADVAREAGVAPITASRVANGAENVDEATRSRVLDTMGRLGYRPNLAARALATGHFKSIGVLTSSMRSPGNMWTIGEIVTAAAERGYTVTLLPFELHGGETVVNAYDRLTHEGVDGAIVVAERRLDDDTSITLPPGVPVIFIDAGGGDEYTVIDSDQAGGARMATEHLLDLGHRTVHHVAGPRESYAAMRRLAAWRRVLEERGLRVPEAPIGDWRSTSGHEAVDALLADGATAIFAANDQMAFGVLQRLHELGIDVPGQVSVVGFDDVLDADASWPPLTTVRQAFDEVGRVAIASLLERIADHDRVTTGVVVPVQLVVRGSTAAPA